MTFATPVQPVPRNHNGWPLIIPPGGTPDDKKTAYRRWSSFGDVLEDRYNLEKWGKRMTALGIADRADLLLAISAHRDDKRQLDDICQQAVEAAKASAAATTGTALHKLSELVDAGTDLPALPDTARNDLEAYRQTMRHVEVVATEQFVVCDEMEAAGTFDRIVEYAGQRFVADIKTGSIKWGLNKIAIQLAGYAHSAAYDPATGTRTPLGVDQNAALIIHLPSGQATCELVWLDIGTGWKGVHLAAQVHDWRRTKGLTAPFQTEQESLRRPA